MTKTIPLTKGYVALVSDEDYEDLSQFNWQANDRRRGVYAQRRPKTSEGMTVKVVKMHRQIMGFPKDVCVDHIDRNTLNNTRENLRLCSAAQNSANRVTLKGYKGVSKGRKGWVAECCSGGVRHKRPTRATEVEAARDYDEMARALHGAFARLNFPRAGELPALRARASTGDQS